jgi:hypothetical protein
MRVFYTVSSDFMSLLQDLIPEVIPSQKCHMNVDLILNSYTPNVVVEQLTLLLHI